MNRPRAVAPATAECADGDERNVQAVVDALTARFPPGSVDQLDPPILHGVALGVVTRRCTMADALRSLAEMVGVPSPNDAPRAMAPQLHSGGGVMASRQHTGETAVLRELIDVSDDLETALTGRLQTLRQLRRLWHEDVSRSLATAARAVRSGQPQAVTDFLRQLAKQSRMKERLELRHVAPALEVVSSALSSLSGPGSSSLQIAGCLDAATALHTRFRPRIANLCNVGGAADAVEHSRAALEQFQLLAIQLEHFSLPPPSRGGGDATVRAQSEALRRDILTANNCNNPR